MTKEKIRYHAFIDSGNAYYTTDTPQNFSYNIEGFLPIEDYKYYVANIEYIKINHNLNTIDNFTFVPYNSSFTIWIFITGCGLYIQIFGPLLPNNDGTDIESA